MNQLLRIDYAEQRQVLQNERCTLDAAGRQK